MRMLAEVAGKDQLPVDARDNSGWTPLMCAAANGQLPALRALLELGASINAQNEVRPSVAPSGSRSFHARSARGRRAALRLEKAPLAFRPRPRVVSRARARCVRQR